MGGGGEISHNNIQLVNRSSWSCWKLWSRKQCYLVVCDRKEKHKKSTWSRTVWDLSFSNEPRPKDKYPINLKESLYMSKSHSKNILAQNFS